MSNFAFFECDANDFHLRDCVLVRTPSGGLTVWPHKVKNPEDTRRTVSLRSEQLCKDMVTAAQETYLALGGTDGEFAHTKMRKSPSRSSASSRRREKQGKSHPPDCTFPAKRQSARNPAPRDGVRPFCWTREAA